MSPDHIKCALHARGLTQAQIAESLGVSPMTVSQVIHRRAVSDRIMRAVADAIGRDRREVFPEYYLRPPKRKTSKIYFY